MPTFKTQQETCKLIFRIHTRNAYVNHPAPTVQQRTPIGFYDLSCCFLCTFKYALANCIFSS